MTDRPVVWEGWYREVSPYPDQWRLCDFCGEGSVRQNVSWDRNRTTGPDVGKTVREGEKKLASR